MPTLTMQSIADLTRVRREVVSMWRTRSAGAAHPVPSPVTEGDLRFEAKEVGAWLEATGRGNNPDAPLGESDNVGKRLVGHDSKKDFWDEVVIITSKDANLTSVHVRYLESRLVQIAKERGRVVLENIQGPTGGADLPEADASDMDYFIEQLRILMPVLGYDIFRGRVATVPEEPQKPVVQGELGCTDAIADSPEFLLRATRGVSKGVDAKAQVIDGEFTVLAGSVVSALMRRSDRQAESTARQFENRAVQHAELMKSAEPIEGTHLARLSKDVAYKSPSAAAAVVLGRASSNGRIEWAVDGGVNYGTWEESQADV